MPLNPVILAAAITAEIPAQIQQQYPDAIPMPFQQQMANACATGFTQILQTMALATGPVALPAAGSGVGITGVSAQNMANIADAYAKQVFGYDGPARISFLMGIFIPTIAFLAQATVYSVSGFGGQATSISGWSRDQLSALIKPLLGPAAVSQGGPGLVDSISQGFTQEIQANGKPGVIPLGTLPPPGPLVAKFS
jgi:hypothetical protein